MPGRDVNGAVEVLRVVRERLVASVPSEDRVGAPPAARTEGRRQRAAGLARQQQRRAEARKRLDRRRMSFERAAGWESM